MPRKRLGKVCATVNGWAVELAIDQQTIQRRLTLAGTKPVGGVLYDARTIFSAIHGEKDVLLNRKRVAEAEALERENLEAEGILVNIEEADKRIWNEILMPVNVELELVADKLAALVNPSDPERAHKVLNDWSEQGRKQINNETRNGQVRKPVKEKIRPSKD
mgnify:CR=1 FL=1